MLLCKATVKIARYNFKFKPLGSYFVKLSNIKFTLNQMQLIRAYSQWKIITFYVTSATLNFVLLLL
jgi:hypothetical protein